MEQEELRGLLNKKYKRENWEKIINGVFPNVSILQAPQEIPHDNDKITSFKNLGEIRLQDGKFLKLFEIHVAENVKIRYNKVELRNLVAKLIDQENMHGVLAIYEQGEEDYRFTFTAKTTEFNMEEGDFETQETDHKRYTYLLGENETCRTASERLYQLADKKDKMTINDVQDAFSVEKLSKQFFDEYKERYLDFVQYITGKRQIKRDNKWTEEVMHEPHALLQSAFNGNESHVRDFVKLMLGRLVFIQFLQKKRWMGVPAEDIGWETGDPNFIHNAFRNFEHKEIFYSQFLEPLFYDALGKSDSGNQIFHLTNTKVPYLNGGLFEKKEYEKGIVDFPSSYFENLFGFFDRYNFTIDENDPEEHAIGIDPEMLGSIFENLLEDNKDKGAFYTPKFIVHYMCQESLTEYLKTALREKNQWPEEKQKAEKLEENLKNFVKKKEAGGIIDFDKSIATALRDVKICDPAIGSGAFPIGLLNEISQCIYVLHDISPDTVGKIWDIDSWKPNEVKKYIIQNSIYGVDIEQGAVDIARLRFWLSLIIDEPEPTALPNLEYKIVEGNSLLSKFEDEVININWNLKDTSHGLFGDAIAQKNKQILNQISSKQKQFFEPANDKKKLGSEIRNIKIDLLINQLELMVQKANMPNEPKSSDFKNRKEFIKATDIYLNSQRWEKLINKLKYIKKNPNVSLEFFDWKLDFPEVMNESVADKVGFDIVIGNPPFVRADNPEIAQLREDIIASGEYNTLWEKWDLIIPFYERSLKLLNKNGTHVFIASDAITTSKYAQLLQEWIIDHFQVRSIDFFENIKVFDASVTPIITIIKNDSNISKSNKIIRKNEFQNKLVQTIYYNTPYLRNNLFKKSFTSIFTLDIPTELLGNICFLSKGMVTNSDEKKAKGEFTKKDLISETKDNEHPKEYIEGKDLQPYYIEKIKYIEYNNARVPDKLSRPTFRELYFGEKIMRGRVTYGIIDNSGIVCNDSIIIMKRFCDLKGVISNSINNSISKNNLSSKEKKVKVKEKEKAVRDKREYLEKISEQYQLAFILGIINSKYAIAFLNNFRRHRLENYFYPGDFRNYPIPIVSFKIQGVIADTVYKIQEKKEKGEDTSNLEQYIDNVVYKLYNLDYKNILIIEPEFSERMTKEEYDNFKLDEL